MIDISNDSLLTISAAASSLPGRPHISTLWRWVKRGVRGVKLETCLIGGRRYTSKEALERFSAATTAAANGEPTPVRTPRQRARDLRAAEDQLARDGI